ncbi:hypothetical protein AYL99_03595 [Fonsecaea erecta]|uniref:Uncharacterized protein n=1 Tax=Fonsecaea erecta TaxID=1367422 RepID=A0A178ZP14_9EURO|nr:hypothetical protein AYL99_03595 [Fonsecaea erecta]OAP61392.1 hypothetical protein AYL99_03595 [Fonsecaea erecta]
MNGSPRGDQRSYSSLTGRNTQEHLSAPATKSSPLPQGYESPFSMKIPMPLHHPTAGLLRTQSPLIGQHMLSFPAHLPQMSTPLARTLDAQLPHSYGSLVTLDPASLSPVPDPVAVAEVKRLVPHVFQPNEYNDAGEVVDALTADSSSTISASDHLKEPLPASNQIVDGLSDDYTAEMAGAEFDVFLSQMEVQKLLDLPAADKGVNSETQ